MPSKKVFYECKYCGEVFSNFDECETHEKNHIKADVIVVDPPRKGCDELCLETIVKMAPEKVVYVSCDSSTLARDVKYLGENGYAVKRVRTVDMFGMSGHVETVALLTKKSYHQYG